MDKTREEFIVFIRQAMNDKKSDAFVELYHFLLSCFVRADKNMDGRVRMGDFDTMIEEAAALPRTYQFAPKASDMYPTEDARIEARAKMFKAIDTDESGYITFEEWLKFSVDHIMGKADTLTQDYLSGRYVKQEEFISFIKKAMDKSNPEYRELYFFLLKCFTDADRDRDGAVNAVEFDQMIEEAAAAPRRVGLAPSSKDMFETDADRISARKEYFKKMDVNNDGTISFDEWLSYSVDHIMGKVADL